MNSNKQKVKFVSLDIDGVLANFTKAACQAHGIHYPSAYAFDNGWLDVQTENGLWRHCRGHDFWATLEKFPWADQLVKLVDSKVSDWRFLSKPSFDEGCYSGKYAWVRDNIDGNAIKRLCLVNGSKAFHCSGPDHLLIDDNTKNCQEWIKAGGQAYLWIEVSPDYPDVLIKNRFKQLEELLK